MAADINGILKSARIKNARMIDRSLVRSRTMWGQNAAFSILLGGAPDYYSGTAPGHTTIWTGTQANETLIDGSGTITYSSKKWENGMGSGHIAARAPSGTVLFNASAYADQKYVSGIPTYTVSGDITQTASGSTNLSRLVL